MSGSACDRPVLLTVGHDVSGFDSGEAVLDDWLRRRALQNLTLAASRTYVVCAKQSTSAVAFYSLSMAQLLGAEATGAMRRNVPKHIPAVLLGRFAVDRRWQGRGLGRGLLVDAVSRSLRASREVSARLMIVHAISPAAEAFYLAHGFMRLPVSTPTLALDLARLGEREKG